MIKNEKSNRVVTALLHINGEELIAIECANSLLRPEIELWDAKVVAIEGSYTKYDIQCHMAFYVTRVIFCDVFFQKNYEYYHPNFLSVHPNASY
jgi:hypothetical protein